MVELANSLHRPVVDTPEVVTLCGSMRFKDLMLTVAEQETARGRIVLMPFSVVAQSEQGGEFKAMLDRLHRAKIDLSDSVIVVTDETAYFGESTRGEIAYAEAHGKPVRYRNARVATPAAQPPTPALQLMHEGIARSQDAASLATVNDTAFNGALLDRLGFVDGAEVTFGGSADNDLAHERAETVLEFIGLARRSSLPRKLLPPPEDVAVPPTLRQQYADAVRRGARAVDVPGGNWVEGYVDKITDAVVAVRDAEVERLRAESEDRGQRIAYLEARVGYRGSQLGDARRELADARDALAALRAQLAKAVVLPDNWREQLAPEEVSETFECVADLIESWRPATEPAEAPCGCFRCQEPIFPRLIADDPDTKYQPHMIVCAGCGNKRCPHATDHRNACTGSNASGQVGSNYGPLAEVPTEGGTHA